jgi:DNA-binding transcriptional regulator YdaS (Cro superfamily)
MLARVGIEAGGVRAAVIAAGGYRALARALKLSHVTVYRWHRIPAERVIAVEKITGLARELLRPDIYPPQDRSRRK